MTRKGGLLGLDSSVLDEDHEHSGWYAACHVSFSICSWPMKQFAKDVQCLHETHSMTISYVPRVDAMKGLLGDMSQDKGTVSPQHDKSSRPRNLVYIPLQPAYSQVAK